MITDKANCYALSVKARHEFISSSELAAKKVDILLLTIRKVRRWKNRRKSLDSPVFPGYAGSATSPSFSLNDGTLRNNL